MATRLIGTDSADPKLPDVVVAATMFSSTEAGMVPASSATATDVLRADGTWGPGGGTTAFATDAETIAGTSTTKAVTPAGLKARLSYIDVRAHGAIGDGVADDSTAVQAAFTAANATLDATTREPGATVVFPPGVYNLGATGLSARCSIEMMPGAHLLHSGTGVALLVDNVNDARITASVRRASATWNTGADTTSVGVRIRNCNFTRARLLVKNFAIGVDVYGEATGSSYNVIDLRDVNDCKIGVRCTGVSAGWANSNEFHGRIRINSEFTGVAGSRYIDLTTGGNGCTFIGMTLEGNTPQYTAEVSQISVMFLNCRWESATGIRLNSGAHVHMIGGYGNLGQGSATGVPIIDNGGVATVISQLGSTLHFDGGGNGTGHGLELCGDNATTNIVATMRDSNDLIRGEIRADGNFYSYRAAGKGGAQPEASVVVDGTNRKVWFGDGTAVAASYLFGTSTNRLDVGPTTTIFRTLGAIEIDGNLDHDGTAVGFYNTTPIAKPTVSGSRAANAALASLLTQLAALGLITDSSTA